MGTTIGREDFLNRLQSVQPGLTAKAGIEQGRCFIFQDGYINTFNEEIVCQIPSRLGKEFNGAVRAAPLLKLLEKMDQDEIEIDREEGKLVILGKRRDRARIIMEDEISDEIDRVITSVGRPKDKEWSSLCEDFSEAVRLVSECGGTDETNEFEICIHMGPKVIEAGCPIYAGRYKTKTGVTEDIFFKWESAKQLAAFGMTEFCKTDSWAHFKNPAKLMISCLLHEVDNYPDLTDSLKIEGARVSFPKNLIKDTEKAEIFSSEEAESPHILVEIKTNKIKVLGEGISGDYRKYRTLQNYKGNTKVFMITPKLLIDIIKKFPEVQIDEDKLVAGGEKFKYVTGLGSAKKTKPKVEEIDENEDKPKKKKKKVKVES